MSERNTVVRGLHDLGLATWFGGALMGAVGLNGAAADAQDPKERLSLSSKGWAKWAPVSAAAIAAHAVGGLGLIAGNRGRLRSNGDAMANTVVKAILTAAAVGATAYSGVLGRKVADLSHQGAAGVTEPAPGSSDELAAAQRQLKVTQWTIPALTGVLVALGAQQGEQQRQSVLPGRR